MDFSKVKFRCSSLGHLMTEPRNKSDKEAGNLSETAITHLIDVYVAVKYGRQSDIKTKYTEKGLMVEEDGITLYSRVYKTFFRKNEQQLENEFIKGTPDIFTGKIVQDADTIDDIKCSWDIYTFHRVLSKDINPLYYWQLQGYFALSNARRGRLNYCLIDTPEVMINDEKRKLMWQMGVLADTDPVYIEACNELERTMKFGDIPLRERIITFDVERSDADIERVYKKVVKARAWLADFEAGRLGSVPAMIAANEEAKQEAQPINTNTPKRPDISNIRLIKL